MDYYEQKHIEHEELVECLGYLTIALIVLAVVFGLYDWLIH
jgi:hypothetical protein